MRPPVSAALALGQFLLLSLTALAAPDRRLDWLGGCYHTQNAEQPEQLQENWVVEDSGRALGTSVWLEHGRLKLREQLLIEPLAGLSYHLSLWITNSQGKTHKIDMKGRLVGPQSLEFSVGPEQHPESLSYQKDNNGHLQVVLAKKSLMKFDLVPGVESNTGSPRDVYIAHTDFGTVSFEDILDFSTPNPTLTVPDPKSGATRFKVSLENLQLGSWQQEFDATIPEGSKPYKVHYHLWWSKDLDRAHGWIYREGSARPIGTVNLHRRPANTPQP